MSPFASLFRIAVAGLWLNAFFQADGAIIQARSLAYGDVEHAVNSAREGDTVTVPAGKEDWTHTLTVSKAITLQFAGIGQSVIYDDIRREGGPRGNEAVISFSTKRDRFYRLTGLELDRGVKRTNVFFNGSIQIAGSTTSFRVDHCGFTDLRNDAVFVWDSACGVIDHCVFHMHGPPNAVDVSHQLWAGQMYGDGSWDTPVEWGSSNAVYIEDCVFSNETRWPWAVLDSFYGARWVFRHNEVFNGNLVTHGTESSALSRGARSCEVYLNQFRDTNNWPNAIKLRSATAVIWSNTASGYRTFCFPENFRNTDAYKFWGPANGKNPLDKNEPGPIQVVTHTGPLKSQKLVVSGANWKSNEWVGFSVIDVTHHQFGLIRSNSATEAYLAEPEAHEPTVFNTGDRVEFYKIIAALDMPGMGLCDKLKRGAEGQPLPPWPNQQIEPIYSWSNTLNGANAKIVVVGKVMLRGVHYFDDTPKPGYTPLTYPHPLAMNP
jgi:hypothetical protein